MSHASHWRDEAKRLGERLQEVKSAHARVLAERDSLRIYAVKMREALLFLYTEAADYQYRNQLSAYNNQALRMSRAALHEGGCFNFQHGATMCEVCGADMPAGSHEIGQSPTIAALKEANDGKCDHGVSLDEPCGACDAEEYPTPAMVAAKTMHAELRASVALGTVCGTSIPIVSSGPEGDKAHLHSPQVGRQDTIEQCAALCDEEAERAIRQIKAAERNGNDSLADVCRDIRDTAVGLASAIRGLKPECHAIDSHASKEGHQP